VRLWQLLQVACR